MPNTSSTWRMKNRFSSISLPPSRMNKQASFATSLRRCRMSRIFTCFWSTYQVVNCYNKWRTKWRWQWMMLCSTWLKFLSLSNSCIKGILSTEIWSRRIYCLIKLVISNWSTSALRSRWKIWGMLRQEPIVERHRMRPLRCWLEADTTTRQISGALVSSFASC